MPLPLRAAAHRLALATALLCGLAAAQAHNVWLEPDAQGGYLVQFGGHQGQRETYPAEKLQAVHAYDLRGRTIAVRTEPHAVGVRVVPERTPALLAAQFDNGFFSRVGDGPMLNRPMTDHPGATMGVHALKFHKTLVQWGLIAKRPLGQAFEIVALTHRTPQAGEPLVLQVLLNGHPAAGVRVSLGEAGPATTTNAEGHATVRPQAGSNQVLALLRQPVAGDARTTSRSYEYLFAFPAH